MFNLPPINLGVVGTAIVAALLPLLGSCLGGCIGTETATVLEQLGNTVTQLTDKLEESGVDYTLEARLPTEMRGTWTGTGIIMEFPNGYLYVRLSRGRGLGDRPPGIGGGAALAEESGSPRAGDG